MANIIAQKQFNGNMVRLRKQELPRTKQVIYLLETKPVGFVGFIVGWTELNGFGYEAEATRAFSNYR
jgi:hypothetical protein